MLATFLAIFYQIWPNLVFSPKITFFAFWTLPRPKNACWPHFWPFSTKFGQIWFFPPKSLFRPSKLLLHQYMFNPGQLGIYFFLGWNIDHTSFYHSHNWHCTWISTRYSFLPVYALIFHIIYMYMIVHTKYIFHKICTNLGIWYTYIYISKEKLYS